MGTTASDGNVGARARACLLVLAMLALGAASFSGCSTDAPPVDGGGPDAGPSLSIPWLDERVPPIAPPAPPVLTPCPSGWREVADGDVTTCDPYPMAGALTCPDGQAHFPGEPACAPVGSACPVGEWAEGLPATGVVYVRAGAASGGTGTQAQPLPTIAAGIAAAPEGSIVAIGAGRYVETLLISRPVILRGACAARTIIDGSTAAFVSAAVMIDSDVELHDVSITGSEVGGLRVTRPTTDARIEGVVVSGARNVGIFVDGGARLVARGVVVRDTRSAISDRRFGFGLDVEEAASVDAARVVIERNRRVGIYLSDAGTAVTVEDAVVRGTLPDESDGTFGDGVYASNGASLTATRFLVDGNRDLGIGTNDPGSRVTLRDVVVRDTLPQESDGAYGIGIDVALGAVLVGSRVLVERSHLIAVAVYDAGSSMTLEDSIVRDTLVRASDGLFGLGLAVESAATATMRRVALARNREAAVGVYDEGSTLMLEDVRVSDTLARASSGAFGIGVSVGLGASATGTRVRVERSRSAGILVDAPGSTLSLDDVVVQGTLASEADGAIGWGLAVLDGAMATATRALFDGNHNLGVGVNGVGATLTLEDVAIRGTLADDVDGLDGWGLAVSGEGSVVARQLLVERNLEVGVAAFDIGTMLTLENTVVRDTTAAGCGDTCGRGGVGAGSYHGAALRLERFLVARGARCGVHFAEGGEVDLSFGQVRESRVGVCIEAPGYDLARLFAGVEFIENAADFDEMAVPLPQTPTRATP